MRNPCYRVGLGYFPLMSSLCPSNIALVSEQIGVSFPPGKHTSNVLQMIRSPTPAIHPL